MIRSRWSIRSAMMLAGLSLAVMVRVASAAPPEQELRATVERFVAAQNAHDLGEVRELLADSPDFLWITQGRVVWGRDAALARFETLYRGTWKLEPVRSTFRVVALHADIAQTLVSVWYTIGAPGEPPQRTLFLLNQLWRRDHDHWRVTSILPIVVPPAATAAAAPAASAPAPAPRDSVARTPVTPPPAAHADSTARTTAPGTSAPDTSRSAIPVPADTTTHRGK